MGQPSISNFLRLFQRKNLSKNGDKIGLFLTLMSFAPIDKVLSLPNQTNLHGNAIIVYAKNVSYCCDK